MFRTIMHRYGKKEFEEHETFEEAKKYGESLSDYGEGFFEYILDSNDVIVYDGKEHVIGLDEETEVGKKYQIP